LSVFVSVEGSFVLLIDKQPPGRARRDFQTSGQIISVSASDVKAERL
jgi:hypothetical protein